eukprot:4440704-Karenia_brevis.AAC.1
MTSCTPVAVRIKKMGYAPGACLKPPTSTFFFAFYDDMNEMEYAVVRAEEMLEAKIQDGSSASLSNGTI